MKKFLFFNDADNDAALYPLDNLLGIAHDANDSIKLYFESSKPLSDRVVEAFAYPELTATDNGGDPVSTRLAQTASITAGAVAYDIVTLTITAGTLAKDVIGSVCRGINEAPHSTGFITVCDDINSVFIAPSIESCTITYASA